MKLTYLLILGGLVVSLLLPQAGASLTAEQLLERCESASGISYCEGYIVGFYDGRTTHDYGIPDWMSCPPTDLSGNYLAVSYHQMVLVFRKWAKDHPEKIHYHDWEALRAAFCGSMAMHRKT